MTINSLYAIMMSIPLYGQTILVPNVHPNAKELKHSLNKVSDSLMLLCTHTIESVTLTSQQHRDFVMPNKKTAQLPLRHLPVGKYTAIVITNKKIIVFTILKHNHPLKR